jgi:hypothetical protein
MQNTLSGGGGGLIWKSHRGNHSLFCVVVWKFSLREWSDILQQTLRKRRIELISSEVSEKKVRRRKGATSAAIAAVAFLPTVT